PSAGRLPRGFARARGVAVVDAQHIRWVAASFRSAIPDLLAAAFSARVDRPAAELPRDRRRDVRSPLCRRPRRDSLLPRPGLARGRRAGGGTRFRLWRGCERTVAAHRANHEPELLAAGAVAACARARAQRVATRRPRRRARRPDGARTRPGGVARAICPGG